MVKRTRSKLRRIYDLDREINDKAMIKALNKRGIHAHISTEKMGKFEDTAQELITGYNSSGRPNGLWYSVGGSWLTFLVANEGFLLPQFRPCCFIYDIGMDRKKILKLDSPRRIMIFDGHYGNYWLPPRTISRGYSYVKNSANYQVPVRRLMGRAAGTKKDYFERLVNERIIYPTSESLNKAFTDEYGYKLTKKEVEYWKLKRWDQVMEDWSGVEFYPYLGTFRRKYFWYSSLDAASGCIWGREGFDGARLIGVKSDEGKKWMLTEYGESLVK